jgi:peptide/nickel transport system permease protein
MKGGSTTYLLGTDRFGRDMLSRIIYGGQVSLLLGFVASTISACIGITLGLLAGYFGRYTDRVIMRLSDVQIAFPFLVIAIAVIAVVGSDLTVLLVLLSVAGWVFYARITRGLVLRIRNIEYVQAANVIGASNYRIVLQHILPNVVSPNLVLWTLSIGTLILVESGLSFLGLGVQPPTPSWGNLLSEGRSYVDDAWWIAIFPGLMITITVLCVNTLGDALRDILDPRIS